MKKADIFSRCSLGVDIGSISTKGVLIDAFGKIIYSSYLWTQGNPIEAVRQVLSDLKKQMGNEQMRATAVGTTGSARRLIGTMLDADVVKNEITAHALGTLSVFPDVRTIFEIGGQDSKIILLDDGLVVDYAMNTLCAAGTGAFLSSQAKRLGLSVEEFGPLAMASKNPSRIAARCTVFAESDLVHKMQTGHSREDIVAGLCMAVVTNYLNNVGKGKNITPPIAFQGGVSRNSGVVHAFEKATGYKVFVDENAHLMGALGVALLARDAAAKSQRAAFDFSIADISFETKGKQCNGCANECEIICFYKQGDLIDAWGNKCDKGGISVGARKVECVNTFL